VRYPHCRHSQNFGIVLQDKNTRIINIKASGASQDYSRGSVAAMAVAVTALTLRSISIFVAVKLAAIFFFFAYAKKFFHFDLLSKGFRARRKPGIWITIRNLRSRHDYIVMQARFREMEYDRIICIYKLLFKQ
jgi:hypothetical protein